MADAGGSSFWNSAAENVPNWTAFDADACAVFFYCRSVGELELLGSADGLEWSGDVAKGKILLRRSFLCDDRL